MPPEAIAQWAAVAVALVAAVLASLRARSARHEARKANAHATRANTIAEQANAIARKSIAFRWALTVEPLEPSTPQNSPAPLTRPITWVLLGTGPYRPTDVMITFSHDPNGLRTRPASWPIIDSLVERPRIASGLTELEGLELEGQVSATIRWVDPEGDPHTQLIQPVPVHVPDAAPVLER